MGLPVLCMSITLDYIQLVPQSSVFRPLDSRLQTPDSGLSDPTAPIGLIGLIRLIGPIVLTVLRDLRDPTKKTKRKVSSRQGSSSSFYPYR